MPRNQTDRSPTGGGRAMTDDVHDIRALTVSRPARRARVLPTVTGPEALDLASATPTGD